MSRSIFIYALLDPDGDISDPAAVRYIGASRHLHQRLLTHYRDARTNRENPKAAWLHGLLEADQKPTLIVLEECTADTWAGREIHWIRHFKDTGAPLTNSQIGGGCTLPLYPERKRTYRRKQKPAASPQPARPPAPKPTIDDQDAAVIHTLYYRFRWPLRRLVDLYETTEDEIKGAIFYYTIMRRTNVPG